MKQNRRFSPSRLLWKLICLSLGLILLGMLVLTAGFRYLTEQLGSVPGQASPALRQEDQALVEEVKRFLDPSDVDWHQLSSDLGSRKENVLNILLIGQDRREGEETARADSIILCTLRKSDRKLTMTSFLRDLYVPIPGHGSNRLNAAYAFGGSRLLKKTLTENFGIPIAGAIEVDFSQFSGVIDALGGVQIHLRKDEARHLNKETGGSLAEGPQVLTGAQALAYSRIRSLDSDGDFSRTDRQRKVLKAMVDAYRDAELSSLMEVLKQVLPMLSTDMRESRLLLLALELLPMLSDLELSSQTIPAPGTCQDKTIDGMMVLVADMEAARALLRQTTQSD